MPCTVTREWIGNKLFTYHFFEILLQWVSHHVLRYPSLLCFFYLQLGKSFLISLHGIYKHYPTIVMCGKIQVVEPSGEWYKVYYCIAGMNLEHAPQSLPLWVTTYLSATASNESMLAILFGLYNSKMALSIPLHLWWLVLHCRTS